MTLEQQETNLGTALALLQRALHKLDDPSRVAEVHNLLGRASSLLDSVRHGLTTGPGLPAHDPELAAIIAAAVAVMIEHPHRVISVEKVELPSPESNAWAHEGRSDIFRSHRVR